MGKQINAVQYRDAFYAAAGRLDQQKELINELNVFPVPDGDTGTNMTMTIMTAAKEVAQIQDPTLDNVSRAMASGSLRGARGNSGVILSQLIRGFTKEIRDSQAIDCLTLSRAFTRAVETAYKAVMKPKEGTILTVAKGMAEKVAELSVLAEDPIAMLEEVVAYGDLVLARTPELLPVLKEAGVVDSGGQGLMAVMKGALSSLKGEGVAGLPLEETAPGTGTAAQEKSLGELSTSDIRFSYCTEFMVNREQSFSDADVEALRAYLSEIGDSIVCFSDENVIKVHVHTNHPGQAFEKGLEMGYLSRMKVDNLHLEHKELLIKDASKISAMEQLGLGKKPGAADGSGSAQAGAGADFAGFGAMGSAGLPEGVVQAEIFSENEARAEKECGFIAVCAGDGLENIFRGIGVDYVLSGGQTMNPSTEDFIRAADEVEARHIFLLPNNKNIILAAKQASYIVKDKTLHLIPSATIPQGIAAMIGFQPDATAEENEAAMKAALSSVSSAEVTYAVRDTSIEGQEIHQDDIMCLGDEGLLSTGQDVQEAVKKAMPSLLREDTEILTLYYGKDTEPGEAEALADWLRGQYQDIEVELEYGGQPVYYYFLSAE